MANKKARAPMPPRNVQAPRRRDTRKGTGNPLSDRSTLLWVAAGGLIVAVAILAAVLASGGGGRPSPAQVKAAMIAAGCTYRDVLPKPPKKDPTNYHADVPSLTTPTAGLWSTSPPSGGAHFGQWAVWGFYTSPVNPRQVVHNEEHGAVVIWWGPKVSRSTVTELHAFYNQKPDGAFGTPYPSLGNKIALTSWTGVPARYYVKRYYGIGHIAVCSSFDQKAFATFRAAYVGQGPEGIPLSDDEPGMGP